MGRKENRQSSVEKKPILKKWWFWLLLLALLGGGGYAAVEYLPFEINFDFLNSSSKKESTDSTEQSTEESLPAVDTAKITEDYQAIHLGDLFNNDIKGSSYEDVTALLGEPNSNVDSEINGAKTKMTSWNNFNGATTITVNFKDNHATGKSISKLAVKEKKRDVSEQFDQITLDDSYTYEQAVEAFGTPDSLSDSLISDVHTTTAVWTTNVKNEITITFDNGKAIAKEQAA